MEDVRDIVVIVFGIGVTVTALAMLVMAFLLFRRLMVVLRSIQATARGVETFSRDVLGPATRVSQVLAGVWQALSALFGQERKEPRGTDLGA